jgi:hypothetical protein
MKKTVIFSLSLSLLASVPVLAQVGNIGNVVDAQCVNGRVNVKGTGNVVTVKGYCPRAVVDGTGNVLRIDRVGKIEVTGTGNFVEYRYLNASAKDPKKKVHPAKVGGGVGNSVSWTKGADFKQFGDSSSDDEE